MKLTNHILVKANLSKTHFAKLAGVDRGTVSRYFIRTNKNQECILKIETAAQVLEENEWVWPDIWCGFSKEDRKTYAKNKKKSNSLDKKFATAFKKAMKANK